MSVKGSVLEALQQNQENYISGEKLSEELGVSRAAVWKAIRALRGEGYHIDAVTNRGYCLRQGPAGLTTDEIRRHLPAKYRNNGLYVYDIIDSTNNAAKQIAVGAVPAGMPDGSGGPGMASAGSTGTTGGSGATAIPSHMLHGTTVVALQQTAGKGRLGRSFFSPKEGIYLSVIIKPDFDLSKSVLVTVAAAAAVAQAIDAVCEQEHETAIKWVNDVYLHGGKVCGILTEGITDFESGQIDHLVIGIGVNTTLEGFPQELQMTAAAVEGDYSRAALAAGIISRLLDYLEHIEDRAFMDCYREKSFLIGQDVKVFRGVYRSDPEKEMDYVPARVLGVDENGGLQVIYTDGSRETLTTGEVTIRV